MDRHRSLLKRVVWGKGVLLTKFHSIVCFRWLLCKKNVKWSSLFFFECRNRSQSKSTIILFLNLIWKLNEFLMMQERCQNGRLNENSDYANDVPLWALKEFELTKVTWIVWRHSSSTYNILLLMLSDYSTSWLIVVHFIQEIINF